MMVIARIFETRRLNVRAATLADVDLYAALWNNPRVMAYVGFPRGMGISQAEIMEKLSRQEGDEFGRLLVVELKTTGQAIGECWLGRPNEEGIAEPDVKLLPEFWGNHYGMEVWRGLVAYLFTHTDCEIVQATPNVENTASIKMQEAVGAVRVGEGVYRFPESMWERTTPVRYYTYQVYRVQWEQNLIPWLNTL